jgi:hypothetical protein
MKTTWMFLDKLATTLVRAAHPCKVSRLDFLISQTESLYRSSQSQTSPRGQFGHFGQHEQCSTNYPKCTEGVLDPN